MNRASDIRMVFLFILFFACLGPVFSQKFLRITSGRLGVVKIREIDNHSMVRYRVKGSFFGKHATVVDMRDSLLYFDNSDAVKLADLRGIGARSEDHFPRTLQHLFFYTGFGLIPLALVDDAITHQPVEVTPGLVYVSATALAAGFLTLWLRNKRIHTGKGKVLQILERPNLDLKPEPASE